MATVPPLLSMGKMSHKESWHLNRVNIYECEKVTNVQKGPVKRHQ